MKPTRVVFTTEGEGKRQRRQWAFGHVHAQRGPKGIELKVFDTPTSYTGTHPLTPQEAQYAADVLRAAVADTDGKACAGKSIQELVMDELLTVLDRLMGDEPEERDPGRAEGLAMALAIFQNPYRPNVDAIREQAMDIWEAEGE